MTQMLTAPFWSAQQPSSDATDGQAWFTYLMSAARSFLRPNEFPEVSSSNGLELFFSLKQHTGTVANGFGVGVGVSNGANGFVLGLTNETFVKYHLVRWQSSGANSQLAKFAAAANPFSSAPATVYKHGRLQFLSDGTVRGRMWNRDTQVEPVSWPLSVGGQSSITGFVGMFSFAAGLQEFCDFIGVGTHGDPAPSGPPVPPSARLRVPLLLGSF